MKIVIAKDGGVRGSELRRPPSNAKEPTRGEQALFAVDTVFGRSPTRTEAGLWVGGKRLGP